MSPRPIPPRYTGAELAERIARTLAQGLGQGLSANTQVGLELGAEHPALHLTRWHYTQELHAPWRLKIEASGGFIERPDLLLWQAATFWQRDGLTSFHALHGRVQSIDEVGDSADLCHYRLTLVPALEALAYSRRSRVFQRVSAVDVAQALLAEHGLSPVELRELPPLPRWRQLSQSRDPAAPEQFETDLHFLRRILADAGLSLWLEPDESGGPAGERLVIARAGLGATPAKPIPLPLSTPAGLDAAAEHLVDFSLRTATAPNIARVWAYNYRDQGRSLRAEFEADPSAPLGLGTAPTLHEEPAYGADALLFDGNATAGIQHWLDGQARLLGQRQHQTRKTLRASSNAAGLWRCGQTVQLGLGSPTLDALWLLTRIEAGSHLSPWLQPEPDDLPPDGRHPHVHFEASPLGSWIDRGWAPPTLPTAALHLEHAHVAATPGATYAYLDPHGRYQVQLRSDEQPPASPGASSRPVRHIRTHAGPDHGWHLPLHEGTEVLLAYHGGHPDTPMIARALHNSRQPDLVTGINASRNVLRTWANNKFRLEDKEGQEHIKLSTEYGLAQLNLGHFVTDQGQARGEGLELRTQHWGSLRAGQGLLISSFAGQPRAGLTDEGSPAHQRYNPGAQDAQGAQAMAEQRSQASEQVGLGRLDALPATHQLVDQTPKLGTPLIHAASAEHLMLLTPASQVFAANQIGAAAQGRLELASADQIRLYAKQGITWHTEGAERSGGGQGGARTDVISHGSDQVQVLQGGAQLLAHQDIVLEFRGESGTLGTPGASLVLTQGGVLTVIGNTEVVSEAAQHVIGGALDWKAGSGSAQGTQLQAASPMEDKVWARFQIGAMPGRKGSVYAGEPYKVYRNGALHSAGVAKADGSISVPHTEGTSEYLLELATGQRFVLPVSASFSDAGFKAVEHQGLALWGHRDIEDLQDETHGGRQLFNFI